MLQLIEPGSWVSLKPGHRFLLSKIPMVWKLSKWSNSWASIRCLDLPFCRRSTRAGALKEEAHTTSLPLGCLGSRFNLPSDLEEPLFHGVCYTFGYWATMMIYSHMICQGQTWSDLAKSCKIHTVRNLVTIPQDSSQLKGIAMPEGQFQPRQRWVKQYAKHH